MRDGGRGMRRGVLPAILMTLTLLAGAAPAGAQVPSGTEAVAVTPCMPSTPHRVSVWLAAGATWGTGRVAIDRIDTWMVTQTCDRAVPTALEGLYDLQVEVSILGSGITACTFPDRRVTCTVDPSGTKAVAKIRIGPGGSDQLGMVGLPLRNSSVDAPGGRVDWISVESTGRWSSALGAATASATVILGAPIPRSG